MCERNLPDGTQNIGNRNREAMADPMNLLYDIILNT